MPETEEASIGPSILLSVKKILGLVPEDDSFDADIILYINSVFSTLSQLGVGPTDGFSIEDETALWVTYLGTDKNLNAVKTYMGMRVRMLFDPPGTSFAIEAMNKQIEQLEWRLNVQVETEPTSAEPGPVAGKASIWDLTGGLDFPPEAPPNAVGIDLITGDVWRNE